MININSESLYCCLVTLLLLSQVTCQESSTLRTCSQRPTPPENAYITFPNTPRNRGYGTERYQEYDKVYFACNMGYELVSQYAYNVMFVTCGHDGRWFPKIEQLGKCVSVFEVKENDNATTFCCKKGGKCIDKRKRCDCDVDCEDGSDEKDCPQRQKIINASRTGSKSSGIISSPGYPRYQDYPDEFNCVYHINTVQGYHVQIDFEEFDLPKKRNKKCMDSVKLISVHPEFLKRRRKNNNKKKSNNVLQTSHSKCGNNGFGRIYSNTSHITINVTLGYVQRDPHKHYRGISLSWQIKSKRDFYKALQVVTEKNRKEIGIAIYSSGGTSDEDDRLYTFVLPMVVVCGIIPLTFLIFCIFKRISKHSNEQNCPPSSKKKSKDKETTPTLTENNLAKFELQNETYMPVAKVHKQHETNQCGSSQNSDLPRYIMSYDIPPYENSSNRQSGYSQHRDSNHHSNRSESPPNRSSRHNSQSTTNSQRYLERQFSHGHTTINSSHESATTASHAPQSSCESQSTNTCSLCHQRRKNCHAERYSYFNKKQYHDYVPRPDSKNSEETYLELYANPQSRNHYMRTTYPELPITAEDRTETNGLLRERCEENEYPYNEQYHQYPHPSYGRPPYEDDYQVQTYDDREIIESSLSQYPRLHRVEKRKMIYLEQEICDTAGRYLPGHDDLYESHNVAHHLNTNRTRGGSLVCTH
uniref:CUB domain-containing protein n=1 Tax=Clytia hemisphaerica TaxID=252671 RepID=A0A7M5XGZ3_9CNID